MKPITVFVVLAMVATAVSLILGIHSMERGGEFDQTHSTRYMLMRVGAQALTLLLLLFGLFIDKF